MDQINQRLARLQSELDPSPSVVVSFLDQGWLVPTLGFCLGILIQNSCRLVLSFWLFVLGLTALCLLSRRFTWVVISNTRGTLALVLAVFAALGAIRLIHYQTRPPTDITYALQADSQLVALRGQLSSPPMSSPDPNASKAFLPRPLPPSTTFLLRVRQVRTREGWLDSHGTIQVKVGEALPHHHLGDAVELYGRLERIPPATNPGQFDRAHFLGLRRVSAVLYAKNAACVLSHDDPGRPLDRFLRRPLQTWAQRALLQGFPPQSPHTGLLRALILGDRSQIDPVTYDAFAQTGLLHLISLSGLHIGILLGMVWRCGRHLGLLKPGRAALCLLTLLLFVILIRLRPPAGRAALIGVVFCLGLLFQRRIRPWHSLALSALILLALRPTQLFEVGWQLSFACVTGILLWSTPLQSLCNRLIDKYLAPPAWHQTGLRTWLQRLLRAALALLCVGLSAYIAGAGVLLYHFHTITPLACVWTVGVFPLVAVLLALGFAKLLLGFIPGVHFLLAAVSHSVLAAVTHLVQGIAAILPGTLVIGSIPARLIVLYYLILLSLTWAGLRYPRKIKRLIIPCMILIPITLAGIQWHHRHIQGLRLTLLNVGHGQAAVLQIHNRAYLLDAGSLYQTQVGRSVILPFLNHEGLGRLDAALLSHHDSDHINGVPQISRYHRIREIFVPPPMLAQIESLGSHSPLTTPNTPPLQPLPPQISLGSQGHLEVLWPPSDPNDLAVRSDNNNSTVLLVHYAGRRLLFCGDIETEVQAELLGRFPELIVDVLVAPHHGSLKTLRPDFFPQLQPTVILCSCSRSQYLQDRVLTHHPGAQLLLTPRNGAITVSIDPNGRLQAKSWLSHPRER